MTPIETLHSHEKKIEIEVLMACIVWSTIKYKTLVQGESVISKTSIKM